MKGSRIVWILAVVIGIGVILGILRWNPAADLPDPRGDAEMASAGSEVPGGVGSDPSAKLKVGTIPDGTTARQSSAIPDDANGRSELVEVVKGEGDLGEGEFTSDDLSGLGNETVEIRFGDYQAQVGEPFVVTVSTVAPPLANFSLLMEYDPKRLAYIEGSVASVKGGIRTGVEFYASAEKRRMIVLSSGIPGEKVLERSHGNGIVSFQLKGLKSGTADLKFLSEGIKLIDGLGKFIPHEVTGGRIVIE